jgi:hypothetical protein
MLPHFRHEGDLYASRNNLFGAHPDQTTDPPVYSHYFPSNGVIKCLTADGVSDQLFEMSDGLSKSDVFIDRGANRITFVSANYVKITEYYTPSSGIDTTATRHHIQHKKDKDKEIILHPGTLFKQDKPHPENPADYKEIPYTYVRKIDLADYQAYISRAASAHNMGHSTLERGPTRTIIVKSHPQTQDSSAGVESSSQDGSDASSDGGGSSPEIRRRGRSPSPDGSPQNQTFGEATSGLRDKFTRVLSRFGFGGGGD